MKTEYAPADEVRRIADRLIRLLHPHLLAVRIEYLFLSKNPVVRGQEKAGTARKVSGLTAFLATPGAIGEPEPFFLIEIGKPAWDAMTEVQRLALVHHELRHCGYDDERDTLVILPHDIEEFDDVVAIFGEWHAGVESFARALNTPEDVRQERIARLMQG